MLAATTVEAAHAIEVEEEEALVDEVGERGLEEERGELAGDAQRRFDALGEVLGQDDEAEADRREHGFRKRADIDHPRALGEALHRRNRLAAKRVFAVEIVLDDPGIGSLADVENGEALLERHGDAERMLAGRGEIDEFRRRIVDRRDLPAGPGDRQRTEFRSGGKQRAAGAEIARLLHPGDIALADEDAGEEVERRLAAGGDHDLVGRATDPAHRREEPGDHPAQFRVAGNVVVAEEVLAAIARAPGEEPAPGLERELGKFGGAGVEGGPAGEGCGRAAARPSSRRAWRAAARPFAAADRPAGDWREPTTRATLIPEPRRLSSSPSADNWSRALTTVFREMPSSPAKVLMEGSRLSAVTAPAKISSRSWSQSWRWSGGPFAASSPIRSSG